VATSAEKLASSPSIHSASLNPVSLRTRLGVAFRDRLYSALTSRPMAGTFERLIRSAASDFSLPDYAS
jgi:hypothetical protein